MKDVTYEEYLSALNVVLKFQSEILLLNDKLKKEKTSAQHQVLLAAFLDQRTTNARLKNGVKNFFTDYATKFQYSDCTVAVF